MNGKGIIFGILLLLAGLAGGYYFATNYKITPTQMPVETVTQTPTLTLETTVTPTPSLDETEVIKVAMKKAIVEKRGASANDLKYTVSKIIGTYAQGGASAEGGGAMWLAAKVNGTWTLVWDGNGTISCSDISAYDFPVSMVPECWNDATGKSIKR